MTAQFIAGEYGKKIIMPTGFDLSARTGLNFSLTRPDGSEKLDIVTNLEVPAVPVTIDGITYAANEYVIYTTQVDDVPENTPGDYSLRLEVDFGASQRLRTVNLVLKVEK